MEIVAPVTTPLSAAQARDALSVAMPELDRTSAALVLALVWVETGRGNLTNFNAGNITASSSYPGEAWRPPWYFDFGLSPKLTELHEKMLRGEAPSAFRAYRSAPEGFADLARELRHTFPSVLRAASSGNAAAFVAALHDSGYSRDYGRRHVPTFEKLQAEFEPLVAHLPEAAAGAGGGLVLLGLAWWFWSKHRRARRRRRWQSIT